MNSVNQSLLSKTETVRMYRQKFDMRTMCRLFPETLIHAEVN